MRSIIVGVALSIMLPQALAYAQVPADRAVTARTKATPEIQRAMASIRKRVIENHTLITHRRLSPEAARRLAAEIKHSNATLASERLGQLEAIMASLEAGATGLAAPVSGDSQLDALARLELALDRYQALFDDPTWEPLR